MDLKIINKVVKIYLRTVLMVDMQYVYFFTNNKIGYFFYCFSVTSSLSSINSDFDTLKTICFVHYGTVFSSTLFFWVILRKNRDWIEGLVGRNYVINLFGEKNQGLRLRKVVIPFVLAALAQTICVYVQGKQMIAEAQAFKEVFAAKAEIGAITPAENEAFFYEYFKLLYRRPEGLAKYFSIKETLKYLKILP